MKALSLFYDLVMPELPGVTVALVDHHLVRVAREFCRASRVLRGPFDPISAFAAQASYDLSPEDLQTEVVQVHKLTVSDVVLYDDSWFQDSAGDQPKYGRYEPPFTLSADMTQIILADDEVPTADADEAIMITGSWMPKQGATQLSDPLYLVHSDVIKAGVLSTLMAMANKPWSAPAQSVLYGQAYASRSQFAATTAQRGNTRAPLRTRKWG